MTDPAAAENRLLRALDGALASVGLYVGAIGPCLATIAADASVSLDTAGLVLTAMALGSVTASGTIAMRFHRLNQRKVAAGGVALLAAGLLAVGLANQFAVLLLFAALAGAGGGLADAGSHGLAVATIRPDQAVSKLNRAFALGAAAGPAWAGVVLQLTGDRWIVFAGLAAATAAVSAILFRAPDHPAHIATPAPLPISGRLPAMVFAMSALLFLYVGAEIGLGGWITSATREAADASVLAGALVSSGYWAALWFGREVSGRALERGWRSERILAASIVGAGLGSLVLAAGGDILALGAVGAIVAGFCFGPIWPAALAIGTRAAPSNAAATMVTLGNCGGAALPWLQGRVLVDAGPRAGMGLSTALCAGMLAIAVAARPRRPQATATSSREPAAGN